MVRLSPPVFSGSKDIKVLLPFYYPWMRLAGWRRGLKRGKPSPERPVLYAELAELNRSLTVLSGGHLNVENEKQVETAVVVARLAGKLALETARP